MSFLQWTFLFGAAAVVGPIVAHLLAKPRFRRVPFTMLQFLRAGRHESHSRRKLRDLLILLLRCTIIVLLAVVFARPVLRVPTEPPARRSFHYLALDDSASMEYEVGRGSLFEQMVAAALDCVSDAPDDATFSIYGLASGRSAYGLTKRRAAAEIKRLAIVPRSAHLPGFLSLLRQASRAPGDMLSATVISDFTPSVLRQFEQIREPAAVDEWVYKATIPTAPADNVAIVDARGTGITGNMLSIDVSLASQGDSDVQRELTARAPDIEPVSMEVSLAPRERRVVHVQMDLGPHVHRSGPVCVPVELALTPPDSLAGDDTYRVAVHLPHADATNVLVAARGEEAFLFETAVTALAGGDGAGQSNLRRVPANRLAREDLDGADTVVFSSIPDDSAWPVGLLKSYLAGGGRIIVFATDAGNRQMVQYLLREGILAAGPEQWVEETVYPEAQPVAGARYGLGEQAARSLLNYRFDRVALKGYWQCRVPTDAECVWRLANGQGFIYGRPVKDGASLLVNTSIDDSLGLLAKSRAWVAFCRFLVGEAGQVRQFCFSVEERPALNLPDSERVAPRRLVEVENCDGSRMKAAWEGTRVLMPPPRGIGWMKTLEEPVLHAGVNLPAGETDMSVPTDETVTAAMRRAFVMRTTEDVTSTQARVPTRHKPMWKLFAWVVILLLLIEPAITNRLKR